MSELMTKICPVILAGGTGSRLWPMSRKFYPKQFIPVMPDQSLERLGDHEPTDLTLFQQTVKRSVGGLTGLEVSKPLVICHEENRFIVAEQLRQIDVEAEAILLEPMGKNTAPAVALAANYLQNLGRNEPMLVLASDHYIQGLEAFNRTVTGAVALAQLPKQAKIVTFGVRPTKPHTGYGYIEAGPALLEGFQVKAFFEKPSLADAERYLASGDFFWNSGMFVVTPQVYMTELQRSAHDIAEAVHQAFAAPQQDLDFIRIDAERFQAVRSESIDYAIMESTPNAAMVTLEASWSDVGSWASVAEVLPQDAQCNALSGDVVAVDTQDCLVRAESRLVATIGIEHLVVVETADAVLVADKSASQQVKQVVERLDRSGRSEVDTHIRVYRPWGWYETICLGERFQVKRIQVKPGERLSLQLHHHRAEHWVVVKGTARITRGKETILLTEDQSSYIPLGTEHRLDNPGKIPLELIEIQTGSYLGEDDIVRFDDQYGRITS